jgi:hypothetical protein
MEEIDELAKKLVRENGMPPDLHVPIAARSLEAITRYLGIVSEISKRAVLVSPFSSPSPNNKLPIWKVKGVEILHHPRQVWVHVNYTAYRKVYSKAFPDEDLTNLVIDHIMNRRLARLKGFEYLRVIPISRAANSSSGNVTEKYGFAYHSTNRMKHLNSENRPFIQYGDIADIVKMLNINTGGKFQQGINDALHYIYEE